MLFIKFIINYFIKSEIKRKTDEELFHIVFLDPLGRAPSWAKMKSRKSSKNN